MAITDCPYNENATVSLLGVYRGGSLATLETVAGAAGGAACSPNGAEVVIDAQAGVTYEIAVDGSGGGAGIYSLELNGPPPNDDFGDATALPADPTTAGGDNRLATKQAGEPDHAGEAGGHSLWYSWTPQASGPAYIAACGNNREIDPLLAVYTGSAIGSLTQVAADDDGPGTQAFGICWRSRGDASVRFDAVAGTTYRIAVDGKGGSVGGFTLGFERTPANDDFGAAQPLSGSLPLYGSVDNRLATKQGGEPNHGGDAGGHSVWYSWSPTVSGPVSINACRAYGEVDPLLAVYTGGSVGALTPVATGSAAGKYCTGTEVTIDVTAGTTYEIALDGRGGSTGGLQLSLQAAASNDDFEHPLSLGGARRYELPASNRFASKQGGEPNHGGDAGGHSIWFKWTAPADAEVSLDTCGSGFDTLLAVYTGSDLGSLTPVAANDDGTGKCAPASRLHFDAVANTTYRIAVDGKGGAEGPVELALAARPRNDDFAAAADISNANEWYAGGSTRLATKQAGEPNHNGDAGGHSVWFSWTPSDSGAVDLDVCAAAFDPVLGLYTGDSLGTLTPVQTSDEGAGGCEEGGRSYGFEAVAGTTYRVAVDGAGGEEGGFQMHLHPAIEHPRSLAVDAQGGGSVLAEGTGIPCSLSCSYDFEVGETVTLEAQPLEGGDFLGWGGACTGYDAACEVTLNADTVVIAKFVAPGEGGYPGEGEAHGGEAPPGAAPAPPAAPAPVGTAPAKPKPLRCKSNQKKAHVHGKAKCVKKKAKHHPKGGHGKG